MNILGIFIGVAGLLLVILVVWLLLSSVRKNRNEAERKERQEYQRRITERNTARERQERVTKAKQGHIPTILYLAKEAERKDQRESFYWYEQAANLDNMMGMYGVVRLSRHFENDLVISEKSKFWQTYIKGLEGDSAALLYAGKSLMNGLGITSDQKKGLQVIENAARRNYIPAMIYLGDWSIAKDNPRPKAEDSNYWYTKAAKLDSAEAMMKLGLNYLHGVGAACDHRRAAYWLESAAEMGYPEAMYHAGSAWVDTGSHGNAIAYIWLYLAAFFDYEPARSLRDEVGNKVGVDSIIVLQRFVKPIIKKMQSGAIGKHLIIKALNKLYKRDIPVYSQHDLQQDDMSADYPDELVDEITASTAEESTDFSYTDSHQPDQTQVTVTHSVAETDEHKKTDAI